jgi:signal transduction histidine kinase
MNNLADALALSAETIVIATQLSQNAAAIRQVLERQGLTCLEADSMATVVAAVQAEAALLIITEEMLSLDAHFQRLVNSLNEQPDWSDIPVILLLKNCRKFPACMAMLHAARHQRSITLLEMPLKRREFTSTVRTCLNNRQRQFELRDTLQQLNESNRTLESFSHTVAHELRNPLNVITGSLDLLKRKPLENHEEKLVQMGLRTSRKMNQTLGTLLEFGKLESRRNLAFEPTDMNGVVERAVAGLQNVIEAHQALVEWGYLPTVQGNPDLLENLVSNLIKNAIVHNDAIVPVIMMASESRGDRHHFQIIDNGPGISIQDQQEIFKLFARGGKRQTEGSGIGLALCQRIVEQHGGELSVESEPGGGSTFHFDLPTVQAASDRKPLPRS